MLLLGGRDKGTALDELVDACASTCSAVIVYGEAGRAIVLSPACASFDEFDSFEQRGTIFKECVAQRMRA